MPTNITQYINIDKTPFQSLTSHLIPELMDHDGNIVAIWTVIPFPYDFIPGKPEEITQKLIDFKKDEHTKFVFDGIWEGHGLTVIEGIHRIIKEADINPRNCYYATGALNIKDIYDDYCVRYGITERINVVAVNAWEFNTMSSFKNFNYTPVYQIKEKNKLFVCYNRMNRLHRTALLGLLLEKNLVENSYYSFYLQAYHDKLDDGEKRLNLILKDLKNTISDESLEIITRNLTNNLEKFPLVLSLKNVDDNANHVRMIDFIFSDDSYFSLVTESFYFPTRYKNEQEHAGIFFSEKIFKPIAHKQPFILVGRPNSLKYLRNMGYKTFASIIDETYDDIQNDELRLLAIINEVERLSKFSKEQWLQWQTEAREIVEHNYKVFMNKKQFIATDGKWFGEYVYAHG